MVGARYKSQPVSLAESLRHTIATAKRQQAEAKQRGNAETRWRGWIRGSEWVWAKFGGEVESRREGDGDYNGSGYQHFLRLLENMYAEIFVKVNGKAKAVWIGYHVRIKQLDANVRGEFFCVTDDWSIGDELGSGYPSLGRLRAGGWL